ncbi:hypothetical protein MGM1_2390 [Candidatus Malacoplasma girerdii]|uniref:Transmembrane protein n=1 Tax=Candidatus Malacoplasma girerdii TaxID=1318617 RepID=A0A097SSQ5_9BACT|nr:hypothetical protein MGM1_2390 [Candidatus Malacoplasma girerdii]
MISFISSSLISRKRVLASSNVLVMWPPDLAEADFLLRISFLTVGFRPRFWTVWTNKTWLDLFLLRLIVFDLKTVNSWCSTLSLVGLKALTSGLLSNIFVLSCSTTLFFLTNFLVVFFTTFLGVVFFATFFVVILATFFVAFLAVFLLLIELVTFGAVVFFLLAFMKLKVNRLYIFVYIKWNIFNMLAFQYCYIVD